MIVKVCCPDGAPLLMTKRTVASSTKNDRTMAVTLPSELGGLVNRTRSILRVSQCGGERGLGKYHQYDCARHHLSRAPPQSIL